MLLTNEMVTMQQCKKNVMKMFCVCLEYFVFESPAMNLINKNSWQRLISFRMRSQKSKIKINDSVLSWILIY